jgi:hypothetical protein
MKAKILTLFILLCVIFGCESSRDGGDNNSASTQSAQLLYYTDPTIECQSTLLIETQSSEHQRNVKSILDNNQLHLAYFSSAGNGDYIINYQNFDMTALPDKNIIANQSVVRVDHCRDLQLGFTINQSPLFMYQGGSFPTCGETEQSDIMLSAYQNNRWQEYTISYGIVERNPVINNGLAGYSSDMIVDSTNTIHMCFQFLYEGCDSMNYNYPDLWYIQFSPDNLDALPAHEVVEGNDYEDSNKQNNAGEHCSMALDNTNDPYIFYYFVDTPTGKDHGLRVAYRNYQDNWETQWIDLDIHVDYISASWNEKQEKMAVAYYVTQNSYGNRNNVLKYAEQTSTGWQSVVVDKSCYCGNYCSLTFDNNGDPVIAYQAEKTRSHIPLNQLKIAHSVCSVWKSYFCSAIYDNATPIENIGVDNTIHVDEDFFYITFFSYETHGIYLITGNMEHIE